MTIPVFLDTISIKDDFIFQEFEKNLKLEKEEKLNEEKKRVIEKFNTGITYTIHEIDLHIGQKWVYNFLNPIKFRRKCYVEDDVLILIGYSIDHGLKNYCAVLKLLGKIPNNILIEIYVKAGVIVDEQFVFKF